MNAIVGVLVSLIKEFFWIITALLLVPFFLLGALISTIGTVLILAVVSPLSLIFVADNEKRKALITNLLNKFGWEMFGSDNEEAENAT